LIPCHATAYVRGQWHLWIYCCEWSLALGPALLARSESSDTAIARALHVLNGQALTTVTVSEVDGSTTFTFDLGCLLSTRPAPQGRTKMSLLSNGCFLSRPEKC
jgi:hypothetical protein